jgi:AcrR family transcriptional regulator
VSTLSAVERFPALPRGRSSLPEAVARAAQRERLLRAIVSATASNGYARVTIGDVVERARVSRNAFYEHFADKEACFLAACAEGEEIMFAKIRDAARAAGSEPAEAPLAAGLRAYLRFLSVEPEFARCFLIECLAAGPRAMALRAAAHDRFAHLHRSWHRRARRDNRGWPRVEDAVYHAMVGATHELVLGVVRADRVHEAPALERTLMPVLLRMLGIGVGS